MARRSLRVAVLVVALALAAPAAGENIGATKTQVDGRIAGLQQQIDAAKQKEGVLTSQLSAVTGELRKEQSAVDEAQQALDRLEATLSTQQAKVKRLGVQLRKETLRLEQLQREYRRDVRILGAHVRAMYIDAPPDLLS